MYVVFDLFLIIFGVVDTEGVFFTDASPGVQEFALSH